MGDTDLGIITDTTGTPVLGINALDADPTTGELFAIGVPGVVGVDNQELFRVGTVTTNTNGDLVLDEVLATSVGDLGFTDTVNALAFLPDRTSIFIVQDMNGTTDRLMQVNPDDATVTEGDGLRLDWEDRWVQVRGSNTEPIVRVISEAPDAAVAHRLCDSVVERVQEAL